MTTSDRMPTATAHQARLRLFQPTRRPQHVERGIDSAWGRVRVVGRLGQQHADVVEAMFAVSEKRALDEVGRIKLLVDPARVRDVARQRSGTTLRRVLDDIMGAVIEIREPERLRCVGHLIDHVDIASRGDGTRITRANPLGGERDMWRVVVGQAAMHLIQADLHLIHDPAPIAAMRHGVSQAVARLVLTHDPARQPEGGWYLDTLLRQACGGDLSDASRRDRRREVRTDADAMARAGVLISHDGERVSVEHKHGENRENELRVEHKHGGVEHKHGKMAERGA